MGEDSRHSAGRGRKAGGICKNFSQRDAFWRAFFGSVALWTEKDRKRAYFESPLGINRLGRGILSRGVKKVLFRHGMPTNRTKNEAKNCMREGES